MNTASERKALYFNNRGTSFQNIVRTSLFVELNLPPVWNKGNLPKLLLLKWWCLLLLGRQTVLTLYCHQIICYLILSLLLYKYINIHKRKNIEIWMLLHNFFDPIVTFLAVEHGRSSPGKSADRSQWHHPLPIKEVNQAKGNHRRLAKHSRTKMFVCFCGCFHSRTW